MATTRPQTSQRWKAGEVNILFYDIKTWGRTTDRIRATFIVQARLNRFLLIRFILRELQRESRSEFNKNINGEERKRLRAEMFNSSGDKKEPGISFVITLRINFSLLSQPTSFDR